MRRTFLLILMLATLLSHATTSTAQQWEDHQTFGNDTARVTLRILSSTDAAYLAPIITDFVAPYPDIQVEYFVTGTAEIYDLVLQDPSAFDLVISSAMDLQIKLVNDGFASRLEDISAPAWTQWRSSLFGFTAEPAAIVLNKAAFAGKSIPQTRQQLITRLRADPAMFQDKIATYDIRRSGLGYLFAAQDARSSETYWRLTEVMGALGTKLYCCSAQMIDAVADGQILVAYNVLGSYAAAQYAHNDQIEIIIPDDFATTMMRTIFVSNKADNSEFASAFVRFLLTASARAPAPDTLRLPLLTDQNGEDARRMIPLEPSIMIYLDRLQRRAFTQEWESAIDQ